MADKVSGKIGKLYAKNNKEVLIFVALFVENNDLNNIVKSLKNPKQVLIVSDQFCESFDRSNFIIDDFKDIKKTINKIQEWKNESDIPCINFKGIIGIDDEDGFQATRKIANSFKLKFYRKETTSRASNKFLMKKHFKKQGIVTPDFRLISSKDCDFKNTSGFRNMKFPVVLKLLTGTGSEFIFLNKTKKELQDNFGYLIKSLKNRKDERLRNISFGLDEKRIKVDTKKTFLLEEFVGGEEYSFDFIVWKGKVKILRIIKKFDDGSDDKAIGMFNGYALVNETRLSRFGIKIKTLEEISEKIALAFQIEKGACMVDFKFYNGKVYVIESSIRTGCAPFIHLMRLVYGYSSLGYLMDAILEDRKKIDYRLPEKEGMIVYIKSDKTGKIKKADFSKLRNLTKSINMLDYHIYCKQGDIIGDLPEDYYDKILGYIVVEGYQEVDHVLDEIKKNTDIKISTE
ncbi:MAG: ATP-grasp domain-containing protein [Nanoarchaeota archaeon]|nr:ATP-grasp domain-containing protein [Nanoarchaeota archaeon]